MSTRSRTDPRAAAATAAATLGPWPGKRVGTVRGRLDRNAPAPWPGKRTRSAALRRPLPRIEEPADERLDEVEALFAAPTDTET